MGDKKGKKDRAKEHRQMEARHAKAAKQKRDRQEPLTMGSSQVRQVPESGRGR